jgi:phosphoglycerol transferase MdoB-like AlkP superfamily enzyme
MSDLNTILEYAKSYSSQFLNKSFSTSYAFAQDYVYPTFRSLLSSHPDIASLLVLLVTLYVSLMVLNTASRWMYSFIMGFVRMVVLAGLVAGAVWVVKTGQGENATESMAGGVQWAMDKGKRYVWDAAGNFLNR